MSDLLRKVAAHIRHLQAERHGNGRTSGMKESHRKGPTGDNDGQREARRRRLLEGWGGEQ